MKYFLLLIGLILAYAIFSYLRIIYYANHSPNPKITQNDFIIGSGPVLKYIAAGDSTAVGEGASTVEQTYPVKIAKFLSQKNTVTYHNIAVRGAKTSDVINTQLDQIVAFQPNIITISIGANDATHLISSETVYKNYRTIIEKLLAQTKATIYITDVPSFNGATLLPYPAIQLFEHNSKKLNSKLLALASERVKVINIHDFGWNNYPDRSVTYSADFFHPSDVGYENWTRAFLDQLH